MPSRQSDAASGSGRGELGWRGSKQPERSSSLPKPHRPSSAKKGYLSREYIRCTSDKPSLAASERNRSKAESAILDKLLLKRYYRVYKDMNVDKHGRVSREQFSNYLREKNPHLAQHSKKLFSEMMKRSNQEGQDTMDFVSILKMLYPQATDCDIAALREMSSSYGLPKKRELLKKLDDASVLYKMLNTPGDNALTPEQMEDGLLGLGQEYHEVWNQVAQLFGPTSDGTQQSVDFMTFFQWYSDVELPATPQ
eukprot:jgi/Tetstr1/453438/TSEL_040419.t1